MAFFRRRIRHVAVYGKAGCHLCEEAEALLARLARRYPLEIENIDIRSDPDIYREFEVRIPVIVIDGTLTLEAPLSEADIKSALRERS